MSGVTGGMDTSDRCEVGRNRRIVRPRHLRAGSRVVVLQRRVEPGARKKPRSRRFGSAFAIEAGLVAFFVTLGGLAWASAGPQPPRPVMAGSVVDFRPASDSVVPGPAASFLPAMLYSARATGLVAEARMTAEFQASVVEVIPAPPPPPPPPPAPPAPPVETPLASKNFTASLGANYTSPWYDGAHRYVQGFGCTPVPLYQPDPSCPDGEGFHHGIDISMPDNTPIYSAVEGRVVVPLMGPAYGPNPLTIRTADKKNDIVLGHLSQVVVQIGDVVHPGTLIAYSGNAGNSEGPHLHFEVRPAGGGDFDAVDPLPQARLQLVPVPRTRPARR